MCFVSDPLWEILLPLSHTLHTSSCSFLPVFDSLFHDVIITPSAEVYGESLPMWLKEGMETFRSISLYNKKVNLLYFVNAENCLSFNKLH